MTSTLAPPQAAKPTQATAPTRVPASAQTPATAPAHATAPVHATPAHASAPAHGRKPTPAQLRARRRALMSVLGGFVGAVALATAFWWPAFALPEPPEVEVVQVIAPIPAPNLEARVRTGEQTELVAALPDEVLAFVQFGISGHNAWQDDHEALEAWTVTYVDGDGPTANAITLELGQWQADTRAARFLDSQVADAGEAVASGEVFVGEEVVGRYVLFAPAAGTTGTLYWRNATVVFRATGPVELLPDFYSAYPL